MTRPRRWRVTGLFDLALTVALTAVIAAPVAGLLSLLLGVAHAAGPTIPPLGWTSCYPLILAAWLVRWATGLEIHQR